MGYLGQFSPVPINIDIGLFPALHGLLSHHLLFGLPGFILSTVHDFTVTTDPRR